MTSLTTTVTCVGCVRTSVVETSSMLSSPLYATSCRGSNNDNNITLPSITLHASRPIPSIMEEQHPAVCQQTTVEICTGSGQLGAGGGGGGSVLVRAAVSSRPVTSRRPRATIHGRAASMPSWPRPVVVPPVPTLRPAAAGSLGQLEETGGAACDDFDDVHEISTSSPRTLGGRMSSSAAISITLPVGRRGRRMSHVTPDFDPPPARRFDPSPPAAVASQVRAALRPAQREAGRRPAGRARGQAAGSDLDAARRRYFSIAEWNRQKVLHLRRASLRRACLTGIPLSWTQLAASPDVRRPGKDGATTTSCRRRHASSRRDDERSERAKPRTTAASETQTKCYLTQPLAPISETTPDGRRCWRHSAVD